jgi:thioredoxin-like negative regulator of GroEL
MKILKFSADYCQPCKSLTGILEKYGITNYEEIDICSEEGSLLTSKYRVRSVPTLIKLDNEGNVLDTLVGVKPDSDIKEFFLD